MKVGDVVRVLDSNRLAIVTAIGPNLIEYEVDGQRTTVFGHKPELLVRKEVVHRKRQSHNESGKQQKHKDD